MSIKGIESQLMITRATDYVKETSLQNRRSELQHDFQMVQAKEMEKHDSNSVVKSAAPEKAGISPERDADGHGYNPSHRDNKKKSHDPEQQDILVAQDPYDPHRIDIKI